MKCQNANKIQVRFEGYEGLLTPLHNLSYLLVKNVPQTVDYYILAPPGRAIFLTHPSFIGLYPSFGF